MRSIWERRFRLRQGQAEWLAAGGCRTAGRNGTQTDYRITPAIRLADGRMDGFVREDGLVFGSYLHGLFDNLEFTGAILTQLAEKKGISLTAKAQSMEEYKESQYDKLADLVRRSLDMEAVYKIMEEYES